MVDYDLVGASGTKVPTYNDDILEMARDAGFCWSGWTYPIAEDRVEELKQKEFRVLVYDSIKGDITHVFFCAGLEYDKNGRKTPDKDHTIDDEKEWPDAKCWLKVQSVDKVSVDINATKKLSDNKPVKPQGLQNRFAYVYQI